MRSAPEIRLIGEWLPSAQPRRSPALQRRTEVDPSRPFAASGREVQLWLNFRIEPGTVLRVGETRQSGSAGARADSGGRDPPFLAARGLHVFGPAQIDRRPKILGQQRRYPSRAADTPAGAFPELVLRLLQQSRLGQQVEEGRGD